MSSFRFYIRPIAVALAIWSCFALGLMLGCDRNQPTPVECGRPCCKVPEVPAAPMVYVRERSTPTPAKPTATIKRMRVTAYCTCSRCCGKWSDGYAASGVRAIGKMIAADKRYPFGTVMHVPGYGTATVEDRGGAIKGDRLDLLFPSHESALQWGVKWLDVTINTKGQP